MKLDKTKKHKLSKLPTKTRVTRRLNTIPARSLVAWRSFGKIKKTVFLFCLTLIFLIFGMRVVAFKYQRSASDQDIKFGTTFVSSYAEHLGLEPKDTLNSIVDDLTLKNLRLVSYWSEHEQERGEFDFSDLDWQFKLAEEKGVKISLAIGLRQPRWPECHMPQWALNLSKDEWYPELKVYMNEVVERYKDSPALASYQLENEYFLEAFGQCTDFSRDRLVEEFNLVKGLDSEHPIILSRSNNYGGFAVGEPQADIYGISVYRKVHNQQLGYFTYPFPAWYYSFLAQGQISLTGKPSIIHEFQLEPWIASGDIKDASTNEQDKTMSAEDIKKNIAFAKKTGIKEVYFWGAEWWYFRAQNGDPQILETVKAMLR